MLYCWYASTDTASVRHDEQPSALTVGFSYIRCSKERRKRDGKDLFDEQDETPPLEGSGVVWG